MFAPTTAGSDSALGWDAGAARSVGVSVHGTFVVAVVAAAAAVAVDVAVAVLILLQTFLLV